MCLHKENEDDVFFIQDDESDEIQPKRDYEDDGTFTLIMEEKNGVI